MIGSGRKEAESRVRVGEDSECEGQGGSVCGLFVFFFFNDTATTEIYTSLFVGSVRGV